MSKIVEVRNYGSHEHVLRAEVLDDGCVRLLAPGGIALSALVLDQLAKLARDHAPAEVLAELERAAIAHPKSHRVTIMRGPR